MTEKQIIKRRIELKKQLIELTLKEIAELEKQMADRVAPEKLDSDQPSAV